MRQLIYAMRFEGQAEAVGPDGKLLRAATSGPSATITSLVGPAGLTGSVQPTEGGTATFESEVTMTGESSFLESGTIAFGDDHRVRFSTVGQGYVTAGAEPGTSHGTGMWQIDGGEGQFAGATGLITSNAVLDENLGVVDHQFGVIYVP
jgi:hypothetical protein